MKSREQLIQSFGAYSFEHYRAETMTTRNEQLTIDRLVPPTDEQLERLEQIQQAGKRHGEQGWYPDGDFSSDADWCYGVGADIQRLEQDLDIDDGAVFDLYSEAHGEHFADGTINPEERDWNHTFDFQFGAYGTTKCSVHARSVESALELAAEWLTTHAPGHLMPAWGEEHTALVREACEEIGLPYPPPDDADFEADGYYAAQEQAEADLTYTESGYLTAYEWWVDER